MDANIAATEAAQDFALMTGPKDRPATLARLRADFAAAGTPARRQANLRLRIALLRHWQIAGPVPEAPAPVVAPPPQPKGVVKLMALDDAARMLMTAPEPPEPAPAPARPKMAIDFSMFGDDDDGGPAPTQAEDDQTADDTAGQDSSDGGSNSDAGSRSDVQMPSEE